MATINAPSTVPVPSTAIIEQNSPLTQMPVDVFTEILKHAYSEDVASCNLVCRCFHQLFNFDSVWQNLIKIHFPFYQAPKEIPNFQQSYKTQYRSESNLMNGVFHLKPYIKSDEDDPISFPNFAKGKCPVSIWNTPKGMIQIELDNNGINIYDLKTNELLHTLFKDGKRTKDISAVLVAENKLFSASGDGTVKIWDIEKGECLDSIRVTQRGPWGLAGIQSLAIDKNKLFAGCYDGSIKILNIETGQIVNSLDEHITRVCFLTIADGKLFSGSCDYSIKIWDIETSKCLNTLNGHNDWVESLTFFHGKLVSVSSDHYQTIKIWDIETGKCLNTIDGKFRSATELNTLGHISSLSVFDENLFLTYENGYIQIMDFSASNTEIFKELAHQFYSCKDDFQDGRSIDKFYKIDRFSKMPKKAKDKIYEELYKIIKHRLTNDYWRCAEHAFLRQNGQDATGFERGQAIMEYIAAEQRKVKKF